jgi:hypothetical protein
MTNAVRRSQGEIEGVRDKKWATLESLVRDVIDADDELKKARGHKEECVDAVIRELKQQDEIAYGWKEDGRLITVSRADKGEALRIQVKSLKKKSVGERDAREEKPKLGFGR